MACGRRVLSISNAWWRKGGQRALSLHPPALPKSRSGCRCIGSRQLADRGRSVGPRAARPVAPCTRCAQRPRCLSAHTQDLLRSGTLADGRVSDMPKERRVRFKLVRERVKELSLFNSSISNGVSNGRARESDPTRVVNDFVMRHSSSAVSARSTRCD